jgi:hypothetical protein
MARAVSVIVAAAAVSTLGVWVSVLLTWLSGRDRRAALGRRSWAVRLVAFLGFIEDKRLDRTADVSPTGDVVVVSRLDPVRSGREAAVLPRDHHVVRPNIPAGPPDIGRTRSLR